jgi:hypothetical protein
MGGSIGGSRLTHFAKALRIVRVTTAKEIGLAWNLGVETGEPAKFSGMFHPVASDLAIAEAKRSRINASGIEYEGKTGLSTSEFSWAA